MNSHSALHRRREGCLAARPLRGGAAGFTLVEVMVALLVMSLLAAMAWQGVDAMIHTRDVSQRRLEATLRLNTALAQWQQDLASVQDTLAVPGLQFDGASLALTRRTPAGLQLVVWSLRDGRWLRWAGPAATTRADLKNSLLRVQQGQESEAERVVVLEGVSDWQVRYFRAGDNAWSNAQSSGDVALPAVGASGPVRQVLPRGVRLVLTFADGSGYVGSVSRDTELGSQP